MKNYKILIITSCTGEKLYNPENKLTQNDFKDLAKFSEKETLLNEYKVPAFKMYTGMQYIQLTEGLNKLREIFGEDVADLYIISAGYGLISEKKEIVPYEVTFNDMTDSEISIWSKHLKIHEDLEKLISNYDIVFFLLGNKYLKAINFPIISNRENQKFFFFASENSKKIISLNVPYYLIESGLKEAKSFSYGLIGLKGYLFKLLAQEIINSKGNIINELFNNSNCVKEILEKYKRTVKLQRINLF